MVSGPSGLSRLIWLATATSAGMVSVLAVRSGAGSGLRRTAHYVGPIHTTTVFSGVSAYDAVIRRAADTRHPDSGDPNSGNCTDRLSRRWQDHPVEPHPYRTARQEICRHHQRVRCRSEERRVGKEWVRTWRF